MLMANNNQIGLNLTTKNKGRYHSDNGLCFCKAS